MAVQTGSSSNVSPIFIGGPDRCGKTTLAGFLSSHSRIAIPAVGSNFWSYFYGQFGDISRKENFERCLAAMFRYKHALYFEPNPNRIREEYWRGKPGYAQLFAIFHIQYAERMGKPRWGDQSGLIERYANQIFANFPQAFVLHMLRDPRDRYEAQLSMWPEGKGKAGTAAARWNYSARLALENQARFPDRYKIIRYEDMVSRPVQVLEEICSLIGEEFEPEMLNMKEFPGHRKKMVGLIDVEIGPVPLSTDFIGRFLGRISRLDQHFLEEVAEKPMQIFGYTNSKIQLTKSEQLKFFLFHRPVNQARMRSWQIIETLQQMFPQWVQRRPSEKMIVSSETISQ